MVLLYTGGNNNNEFFVLSDYYFIIEDIYLAGFYLMLFTHWVLTLSEHLKSLHLLVRLPQ